jgi:hypothetical protein
MVIALLLHVTLVFPSGHPLSPLTLRTAVAEASLVWSPYGVAIDVAAPGTASGEHEVLTVVLVERPRSSAASKGLRPLGAITFDPDGMPEPVIAVFLADILCFVSGARVVGTSEWQWPPKMREEVIGRVLGRVLAHEVGHYLLRSPQHASEGLMQRVQFGDAFVRLERHGFKLSEAEAARIAPAPSARAGR